MTDRRWSRTVVAMLSASRAPRTRRLQPDAYPSNLAKSPYKLIVLISVLDLLKSRKHPQFTIEDVTKSAKRVWASVFDAAPTNEEFTAQAVFNLASRDGLLDLCDASGAILTTNELPKHCKSLEKLRSIAKGVVLPNEHWGGISNDPDRRRATKLMILGVLFEEIRAANNPRT